MSAGETYLMRFGEHERAGRIPEALNVLWQAMNDHRYADLMPILQGNIERIVSSAQGKARRRDLSSSPIYEHANNPNTYVGSSAEKEGRPLISLTTISTRLDRVGHTISTALEQTLKPHSINLYISPDPYLIDEGVQANDPNLEQIAELGANIYFVGNIGPYRKQYPIIRQLHKAGASFNTPLITIDDDVIYPNTIVEQLMTAANKTNAVVSHRGRQITFRDGWYESYKSFVPPGRDESILNIGTGRNGIAYRLGHFPTSYNDYVGPCIAPTADDLWCKLITANYCIPTIILEPTAMFDTKVDFKETAPMDKRGLFHNFNAKGRNDVALTSLELYFSTTGQGMVQLAGAQNA